MGFELDLDSLYNEIASLINDIIPTKWDKFFFHGELKETDGGEVYFFYTLPDNLENIKYCYFIPDDFKVDRNIYDELIEEVFSLLIKLQEVFKTNDQELWYSFTMVVDSELKMQANFDYIDWSISNFGPTDRKDYFQYKYIGIEFKDDQTNELMKQMELYEQEHKK